MHTIMFNLILLSMFIPSIKTQGTPPKQFERKSSISAGGMLVD